jgi:hypothetical protein
MIWLWRRRPRKRILSGFGGQVLAIYLFFVDEMRCVDILSASGPRPVTVETLQADIDDDAPQNADGTMNLLEYVRWLVKETLRDGDWRG